MYNEFLRFLILQYSIIGNLGEPTFRAVSASSLAHLVEENELHLFLSVLESAHIEVCAHRKDPLPGILVSSEEVFQKTSLYVYKGSSSRHVVIVIAIKEVTMFRVAI